MCLSLMAMFTAVSAFALSISCQRVIVQLECKNASAKEYKKNVKKMNVYVENKLIEWGLVSLIDVFKEEEFDEEAFKSLDYQGISSLIPKQGLRAKFWKKFNEEFLSQAPVSAIETPIDVNSYVAANEIEVNSYLADTSIVKIKILNFINGSHFVMLFLKLMLC